MLTITVINNVINNVINKKLPKLKLLGIFISGIRNLARRTYLKENVIARLLMNLTQSLIFVESHRVMRYQ